MLSATFVFRRSLNITSTVDRHSFSSSTLAKWTGAVSRKLPELLACNKDQLGVLALLGDKILDLAVTRAVLKSAPTATTSTEFIAKKLSQIISNAHLARHANTILPPIVIDTQNNETMGHWTIATKVEAAVALVDDDEAVADLAEFLRTSIAAGDDIQSHPKMLLLELGGTLVSQRKGGPDHSPIYEATARFKGEKGQQVLALGSSKKEAETIASSELLDRLGLEQGFGQASSLQLEISTDERDDLPMQMGPTPLDIPPTSQPASDVNKWVPLQSVQLTPQNGLCSQEWWRLGAHHPAFAFQRAMSAPKVFERIVSVESWMRQSSAQFTNSVSILTAIVWKRRNGAEFVSLLLQKFNTVARLKKRAGLTVCKSIAKILSLPTGKKSRGQGPFSGSQKQRRGRPAKKKRRKHRSTNSCRVRVM